MEVKTRTRIGRILVALFQLVHLLGLPRPNIGLAFFHSLRKLFRNLLEILPFLPKLTTGLPGSTSSLLAPFRNLGGTNNDQAGDENYGDFGGAQSEE